jgi:EAL domain-containing protein (putative c-di-GMP-specific phosphodiesterase class I)
LLQKLDCLQLSSSISGSHGIISIRFADPEQHNHSEVYTAILIEVSTALKNSLDANDQIARTSVTSIGILIKRDNVEAVEKFSSTLYDLIRQTLKKSGSDLSTHKFGVGLVIIDDRHEDSDTFVLQAEDASLNAYRQQASGYITNLSPSDAPDTIEELPDQFQKQQFSNALKTKLIEFQEQAYLSTDQSDNQIIELIPRPAPATDIILISDNIFLTAEHHRLNSNFDQYLCYFSIQMLGKNSLQGLQSQILHPISSKAIYDDTLIDFIKTELRRIQLVGTGLNFEFNLPTLAKDLKRARQFLGNLSALGINTILGDFACNETAYKVLAYLNADGVRPHRTLMKADYEEINDISTQIHSLNAKIILPRVDSLDQVSLYWSEAADYVQSSY